MKTLPQIIQERPFPDYLPWWSMGKHFFSYMSNAIVSEWVHFLEDAADITVPQQYAAEYIDLVYGLEARPRLAERFQQQDFTMKIQSGEFDALSYAFHRHVFEQLAIKFADDGERLTRERRLFTERVGARFYAAVAGYLELDLPSRLDTAAQLAQLQEGINRIGVFLQQEGYLRDHFAFKFDVHVTHADQQIDQTLGQFLANLEQDTVGYALYEMGYPAILPSAVYLYHTMGEAQHHSSRTIEQLFAQMKYEARETDDFDPTGFPSEMVVELWEIRQW